MAPIVWLLIGVGSAVALAATLSALIELCADWRARRAASAAAASQAAGLGADEEQPPAPRKVAAVIGGGVSGLVCSKRLLAEGFEVIGFERADQLGGLWVFREGPEGKTYMSLRANVHKERLQMEDFPMPASWPRYPSHWQLAEYLQAFAAHFGLNSVYKMQTEVVSCRRHDNAERGWAVTYRPVGSDADADQILHVDAVVMCVGQTCAPSVPDYPGQEKFRGRVLHTSQYRGQAPFAGQRVLVVGAGAASGTDVAQDLSFGAKQVFLSVRRGVILLPRFLGGRPNAEWFEQNIWNYVPLAWVLRLLTIMVNMMTYETFGTGSAEYHGIKGPSVMDTVRTRLDEVKISDWTATDCNNLTQRVAMGAVRMKGAIERFEERGVRFQDGSFQELDAVIWATGFKRDCTGLGCNVGREGDESKRITLWRSVFHPDLPGFACCLQTHPYGSHWAVADMEARWIVGVLAGRFALPPAEQMARESIAVSEHQSKDTCLDTTEVAAIARDMGFPRPNGFRLMGLLLVKPARTIRWLRLPKTTRRITVDECAEPTSVECKYDTAL